MSGRITAADIATHLGVAKSTVTHVLNGRATQLRISEATQARVQEAARELGYRPNAFARAISTGRFGSAALVQPLHGIYLPHWLVLGLTEELHKNDMSLTISEAPESALREAEFLPKVVRELAADGLLINMVRPIPPRLLETLQTLNTPAIWINNKQRFDAVHPDDLVAGRMATEHLLNFGHQRIAFVASGAFNDAETHYSVRDRRLGYEKAMRTANLSPQVLDFPGMPTEMEEFRADQRVAKAMEILAARNRPTAIIAYGLDIALPILQAAPQLNLRLPQDLSLVMFYEEPNRHIGRPVTTICISIQKVACEAVRMLMQKIETPGKPLKSRAIAPWIFEGNTTGPLSQ